jgi:hypothetical protein
MMRKFLDWLYAHGVGLAYATLITVSLAISTLVMLGIVVFAKVLDRIR